jgi:hypothetical protein
MSRVQALALLAFVALPLGDDARADVIASECGRI